MSQIQSLSSAPTIFSAPLISAETPILRQRVLSAAARVFSWIRSLLVSLSLIQEKKVTATVKPDLRKAHRTIELAEKQRRPDPIGFLWTTIRGAAFPALISWYNNNTALLNNFLVSRVVAATSPALQRIGELFFPTYSDASRKCVALSICAPIVWNIANRLGYQQSWGFFFGVGMQLLPLVQKIYGQPQSRKQREQLRLALITAEF